MYVHVLNELVVNNVRDVKKLIVRGVCVCVRLCADVYVCMDFS